MFVICNQITNCSTIKRDTTYLLLTTSFICWRCSWYFVDHHHNRPVKKLTSVIPKYQLTRLALIQRTACSCLLFCILVVPLLKSSLHDGVLKHRSSPWKVQIPVASNWCSFPSYVTTSVGNIRWQSVIFGPCNKLDLRQQQQQLLLSSITVVRGSSQHCNGGFVITSSVVSIHWCDVKKAPFKSRLSRLLLLYCDGSNFITEMFCPRRDKKIVN